jgi:hypothetical protein
VLAFPLFLIATGALVYEAALGGLRAPFGRGRGTRIWRARMRLVTALLYLFQPAARLGGRLRFGLAPWRRRGGPQHASPRPRTSSVWSERWQSPDARLRRIETDLQDGKCVVERGGDFERWDLQVRGGGLGSARMRMAVEEHGGGKQLLRFRVWPRCSRAGLIVVAVFAGLATAAAIDGTTVGAILLGAAALVAAGSMMRDCATAMGVLLPAVEHHADEPRPQLDSDSAANGALTPAQLRDATQLLPRISPNGSHPDGAPHEHESPGEAAHGNGSVVTPTPLQLPERRLDMSERED